jgi:hypothetical protein
MSDEVDTGVLRSIESHLRENPMSIESDKSDIQSATTTAGELVLGTMLPDLFAGEMAAMGRLLVKMSAALSRRALAEQDVLVRCRDAANEIRAQALLIAEKCTKEVKPGESWNPLHGLSAQVLSNQLLDLSAALTEAAESLNT